MKLQSQLLLYLDQKSVLIEMKLKCGNYLEKLTDNFIAKFPPFRFLLEIDVLDMFDLHYELGDWLLEEPNKFQRACSNILFACLQTLNVENKAVESEQVVVNIRLKCVPRVLVRRNPPNYTGLIAFYGLLLAVSKPENYVHHSVWSCPEECEGNEVILRYIPKVTPKCYMCKSTLFENCGLRRCGEQVTATFILRESLSNKTFKIVDDLITKLKLGSTYNIHVVTIRKSLTVWSLEEVIPLRSPMTEPVPADVKSLFRSCKGIPWQFIYCLASSIGVGVCPLHTFMHLRICLLLSLASVKANTQTGSTVVHVLAAGYDTGYVGRLMEKGAELADRAVTLGTSNTAASLAMLGSSGGVCVLPLPLHVYNQKQTSAILSTMETGEIITETSRVKLQCAVWAQGMDFKKIVLFNIASIFGTVCRGDYGEYNEEIVDFILENVVDPPEANMEKVGALQDVAIYIDLIAGLHVSLNFRTEKLLRDYFLTARRERPKGVTVGSMSALVAICLTSARLCRRTVANVDDAVFAIWLHVCGSPEPRCAPEEYLQTPSDIKTMPKMINNFKNWLEQFTSHKIL